MKRIAKNGMTTKLLSALALTAALLVPLAIFGGPALARSTAAASEYEYSGSSQYQYRVVICHLTGSRKHPAHTITVSSASVAAHLRRGDHLGACTGSETPKPKHGKGGSHGESGTGGHGHGHGK